jgi:hypothetical protein
MAPADWPWIFRFSNAATSPIEKLAVSSRQPFVSTNTTAGGVELRDFLIGDIDH